MVWIGVMTEVDAFGLVDWNVMAILVSVWVIAGYFGKTGVPSWLSVQALRLSGGRPGLLVMILSVLAGVISMFVDNVVVILMMAPVALPLARALKLPVTPLVLMIGFSANFMGSAMLLGDLPPQMLHSVAGAEFMDFFWQHGRPSSFPILMVTFVVTLGRDVRLRLSRATAGRRSTSGRLGIETHIPNRLFATVVVGWFLLTVLGMAFRQVLGRQARIHRADRRHHAGAGARAAGRAGQGAELRGDPRRARLARDLLLHRAVRAGRRPGEDEAARSAGHQLRPLFAENFALGATLLYWITVPIVGIVEHDAYILTFLYTIRDLREPTACRRGRCGGCCCGRARWAAT